MPLVSRLGLLGCVAAFLGAEPTDAPPAVQLWQQGQNAMLQDQADQAISCYLLSLKVDPTLTRNFLSLAAAHIHKGEDEEAAPWLGRYVALQPDHLPARSHYAELLWKLRRTEGALVQFQRVIREVQLRPTSSTANLIQAHTRLMEIARIRQDDHGENLHRGIAVLHLAETRPDSEGLLIQATVHLMQARKSRPESARACWYLHRVWAKLGQQQTALKWLNLADEAVTLPEHDLTPGEVNDLHLASAEQSRERRR